MTSNPKLPFPTEAPAAVESTAASEPGPRASETSELARNVESRRASSVRLWVRRAGVLLFVFLCATLGVMLMILPWRPEWSENSFLVAYPAIRELLSSGFIRGIVTGLGLVNVWIGFWEAIQYREE
ncbi:MAG: hypothetical protein WBS24_11485 [Terriglobales bacterium]